MILDQLIHRSTYNSLGVLFDHAFGYLETFSVDLPDGRYEILGDDVYAMVQSFISFEPSERSFESHLKYADIHYILSGKECIYYSETSSLIPKAEYDIERDVIFYEDHDNRPVCLTPGQFVILWPQDGHKPSCIWQSPENVKKVVIKVRVS